MMDGRPLNGVESVKCGVWWLWERRNGTLFIRDCNANARLSKTWLSHSLSIQPELLTTVVIDPLQDLIVAVSMQDQFFGVDAGLGYQVLLLEFRLASSQLPHPDSACTSLECKHTFNQPGNYFARPVYNPAICGDRIVVLYYIGQTQDLFVQVIDWRKGRVGCVSQFLILKVT